MKEIPKKSLELMCPFDGTILTFNFDYMDKYLDCNSCGDRYFVSQKQEEIDQQAKDHSQRYVHDLKELEERKEILGYKIKMAKEKRLID